MPWIDQELIERLVKRLDLSKSQIYRLIDAKVRATHLPRHLAAIALAAERGINISRFASAEDLTVMRQGATPGPVIVQSNEPRQIRALRKGKIPAHARSELRRGNTVFVVHGRNATLRDGIFAFLRAIGLRPLEWSQVIRLAGKGSPYVGEVLEAAFREAAAIVVLLTPDDEARLRSVFVKATDPPYEKKLSGQARPNVLFEAGMAFGKAPNSTVLVQIGKVRPFSDVGGRHVVHLSNEVRSRQEFVTKLENAGCNVDRTGTDWLSVGNFELKWE